MTRHLLLRRVLCLMLLILLLPILSGCVAVRYVDSKLPALRFDRPSNQPLPTAEAPEVQRVISQWQNTDPENKASYPTPYHRYVAQQAVGSYEADPLIGLAFSGGGSRGVLFSAACIAEFQALGPLQVVEGAQTRRMDLLKEVDYVSGVSTGAIPAALYVLDQGGNCPEGLEVAYWPENLNLNPIAQAAKGMLLRPDWALRDFIFDMNSRPVFSAALAHTYFEGRLSRPASGLTFGDLPESPVLLIGSAIINNPGAPFVFTRLPYRYALSHDQNGRPPVDIQSFESFHSDPMSYPLGEACYNSLAYPGVVRSGLLQVMRDPPWVYTDLEEATRHRMERARMATGYDGVYELKDGGLIDNRGIGMIGQLFEALHEQDALRELPLLISIDAGYHVLREPSPGSKFLRKGWFQEMTAAFRTSWQAGQSATRRLVEAQQALGAYDLVRFRYTDWLEHMPDPKATPPHGPETQLLLELCAEETLVGSPDNLLAITQEIGTTFTHLREAEMAAIRVAARFAVQLARQELLDWAQHRYEDAYFAAAPTSIE